MLWQIRSLAEWKKQKKKKKRTRMIPVAFLQLYSVLRKCAQSTFEQNEGLMWNHGNKPDKNSAGWITRAQLLCCLNLLHPPLSFFIFFFHVPLSSQPSLAQRNVARWPSFTAGWHTTQKQVKIFNVQGSFSFYVKLKHWSALDFSCTDISKKKKSLTFEVCALEYQPGTFYACQILVLQL